MNNTVIEILGSKLYEYVKCTIKGEEIYSEIVLTPGDIAGNMLSLNTKKLKEELKNCLELHNQSKEVHWPVFLDLYCKSGVFLTGLYKFLMEEESLKSAFPEDIDRHNHILNNMLYGICPDDYTYMISSRNLYGTISADKNLVVLNDYDGTFKRNSTGKEIFDALSKLFKERGREMKIDHVVMNPPYNKGMDLDFIDFGYKITKQDVIAIVPSKCFTADDQKTMASKNMNYEQFREEYSDKISDIVYYPDSADVFNARLDAGIVYFKLNNRYVLIKSINAPFMIKYNTIGKNLLRAPIMLKPII